VHATLNARTSILAAANPLFGRYDKSKALKQNINISAPIMSRFDLFFVICDETSEASDAHLSEFLLNMHRNKERALTSKYDTKTLKLYISTARKLKPRLTIPAGELLKKYYHNLRVNDKTQHNTSYRVTVRQL
jgi:DNA replication licensing factor MCM6